MSENPSESEPPRPDESDREATPLGATPDDDYLRDIHRVIDLLRATELEVSSLRLELESRATQTEHAQLAEEHEEINRLDEHLASARVRWKDVYTFLRDAFAPLHRDRGAEDDN